MKMRIRPTVAIILLVATVLLGALTPMDVTAGQKSLVGSWIVDVMPDPPARRRSGTSRRTPRMASC